MKSYTVLIRPGSAAHCYAYPAVLAFRGHLGDLATELTASEDDVIARARGGELILVGPHEEAARLRVRRFTVSQDDYVGEREPSHGLLTPFEALLLRALYDLTNGYLLADRGWKEANIAQIDRLLDEEADRQ